MPAPRDPHTTHQRHVERSQRIVQDDVPVAQNVRTERVIPRHEGTQDGYEQRSAAQPKLSTREVRSTPARSAPLGSRVHLAQNGPLHDHHEQ
jgi:hypothetical protein